MNSNIEYALYLNDIAEKIKKDRTVLATVPFENIIGFIQQFYEMKCKKGGYFSLLYGNLLTKALEHQDCEEIVKLLILLANHIIIIERYDTEKNKMLNTVRKKEWSLQSAIGYYKNKERIREWHARNAVDKSLVFKGKGVVYSAIIGNYDAVKEPEFINPNLDYILFTDNPNITSEKWQIRYVDNPEQLDNVRLARRIKVLGDEYLSGYDYSIWIDGKLKIKDDLQEYVERYRGKEPILCFNHYVNDCIYQEMLACESLHKDEPEIMKRQVQRYFEEGYPEHNGLVESGFLVRELHNPSVQRVMKTWWEEIRGASRRDQLSFNYACWKNNVVYDSTDLFIYDNKYVELHNHN